MNSGAISAEQGNVETFILEWSLRDDAERHSEPVEPGNVPRVSRLIALAIKFDDMIQRGEADDYASIARLGFVTRARMTQVMALLNLAPDIQQQLLFLPRTVRGRDPITERDLRPVTTVLGWERQREMWAELARARLAEDVSPAE